MSDAILFQEVPLKKTEKAAMLAEPFAGRVFRIDPDSPVALAAYGRWTAPMLLKIELLDDETFVLKAREVFS